MSVRDLIPGNRRNQSVPAFFGGRDPLTSLHREVDRLFDDAFRGFVRPSLLRNGFAEWPNIEVNETDREVHVTAELPGMKEKDLDVSLSDGALTIRGERKSQNGDGERRVSEFYYGSFERRIPLDFEADAENVKASFANGVLNVTIPKSEKARESTKRIPIDAN
jgi:HSP20 family protein